MHPTCEIVVVDQVVQAVDDSAFPGAAEVGRGGMVEAPTVALHSADDGGKLWGLR